MPTVQTHPLAELLQKKLFGITTVPQHEQKKMVERAIKAAVSFSRELELEILMNNAILESIYKITNGESVSDFELSFPIVRRVADKIKC